MALRMAFRRASSSSSIFLTRCLSRNSNAASAASAPAFANRSISFFSVPIVDSGEDNCTINSTGGAYARSEQFCLHRGILDDRMENPFQTSGPKGAFEAKKVQDRLYLRMEMPGIEKDDVKIWVEYGTVYVKGEGKKEHTHEESGRTYDANLEIPSNCLQVDNIDAEMKNGVLRMVIPKAECFQSTLRRAEVEVK